MVQSDIFFRLYILLIPERCHIQMDVKKDVTEVRQAQNAVSDGILPFELNRIHRLIDSDFFSGGDCVHVILRFFRVFLSENPLKPGLADFSAPPAAAGTGCEHIDLKRVHVLGDTVNRLSNSCSSRNLVSHLKWCLYLMSV